MNNPNNTAEAVPDFGELELVGAAIEAAWQSAASLPPIVLDPDERAILASAAISAMLGRQYVAQAYHEGFGDGVGLGSLDHIGEAWLRSDARIAATPELKGDAEAMCQRLEAAVRGLCSEDASKYIPRGVTAQDCVEAAAFIRSLQQRNAELESDQSFIWKWIERGMFDKSILTYDALEVIANYPEAPWKNGRWDVDHKPYAAAFYVKFPKAAAVKGEEE